MQVCLKVFRSEVTAASCMMPSGGFILNAGVSTFCWNNSVVSPYLQQLTSPHPPQQMDYTFFTITKTHKQIGCRPFKYKYKILLEQFTFHLKSIISFLALEANLVSCLKSFCCWWSIFSLLIQFFFSSQLHCVAPDVLLQFVLCIDICVYTAYVGLHAMW